ncbi:hypothetical protein PLICRDRAFT_33994 [Plicaturopsis crispa FD-325 SS-3]|nr:hypothetical protein PLICRDRAFT_33994 [Plicaturopsis crispa FD-325 SS-3]
MASNTRSGRRTSGAAMPSTTSQVSKQPDLSPLESLLVAQAVHEYGANSWTAVSNILKKHPMLSRPKSFFSAQACQAIYKNLMNEAEIDISEANNAPKAPNNLSLAQRHYQRRLVELRSLITAQETEFKRLVAEIDDIRAGKWDDKITAEVTGAPLPVPSPESAPQPAREPSVAIADQSPLVTEDIASADTGALDADATPPEPTLATDEPVAVEEEEDAPIDESQPSPQAPSPAPVEEKLTPPEEATASPELTSPEETLPPMDAEPPTAQTPVVPELVEESEREPESAAEEYATPLEAGEPPVVEYDKPEPEQTTEEMEVDPSPKKAKGKRKASDASNSARERKRVREESASASVSTSTPAPTTPVPTPTPPADPQANKRFQVVINMLHQQISQHRSGNIFHNPIKATEAPDYRDIVHRPMDLKTIRARVREGVIQDSTEFQRDVYLMFANAMMYNRPGSDIYMMAEEMMLESEVLINDFRQTEGLVRGGHRL